ncbi:MAG TPA: hypothetical protein VGN01_11580, partial [Acidobacteriaceae bacterium]
MTPSVRRASLSCQFLFLAAATTALAAPPAPSHWVGTWATAPMAANNGRPAALVAAPPAVAPPSNSTAPVPPSTQTPTPAAPPATTLATPSGRPPLYIYGNEDVTLREIVHVSIGGPQVRVIFTNEFGTEPLTIAAAHIGVSQGGSTINTVSTSSAGLTFSGRTNVTIPPGALIVSDPAAVTVPAESDLAVSLFLPAQTIHQLSQHG